MDISAEQSERLVRAIEKIADHVGAKGLRDGPRPAGLLHLEENIRTYREMCGFHGWPVRNADLTPEQEALELWGGPVEEN